MSDEMSNQPEARCGNCGDRVREGTGGRLIHDDGMAQCNLYATPAPPAGSGSDVITLLREAVNLVHNSHAESPIGHCKQAICIESLAALGQARRPPTADSRKLARTSIAEWERIYEMKDKYPFNTRAALIDRIAHLLDRHPAPTVTADLTERARAAAIGVIDLLCELNIYHSVANDEPELVGKLQQAFATFAAGERAEERERVARVADAERKRSEALWRKASNMGDSSAMRVYNGRQLAAGDIAAAIRALGEGKD